MITKWLSSLTVATILLVPTLCFAAPADEEKKVFAELQALIPQDHIVTVDDLYKKWREVQEKKSDAVILDIRTGAEFYAGHLLDANNIDSGNPYLVPKHWPDPNTEIWVSAAVSIVPRILLLSSTGMVTRTSTSSMAASLAGPRKVTRSTAKTSEKSRC